MSNYVAPNDLVILSGIGGLSDGVILRHWWGIETMGLYYCCCVANGPATVMEEVELALSSGRTVYLVSDRKTISSSSLDKGDAEKNRPRVSFMSTTGAATSGFYGWPRSTLTTGWIIGAAGVA